jgi:hypothetical protein
MMKLYHHKTGGGAEYLTDTFVECPNGEREGTINGAQYIVRIDGDIARDAELTVTTNNELLAALKQAEEYLDWESEQANDWQTEEQFADLQQRREQVKAAHTLKSLASLSQITYSLR